MQVQVISYFDKRRLITFRGLPAIQDLHQFILPCPNASAIAIDSFLLICSSPDASLYPLLIRQNGSNMDMNESSKETNGRWVMISYNWDVQGFAKQLCFALQAEGYLVWMDILDGCMGGNTLDRMAEAVSKASVILCIITEKYKESANCRREASYAHDLDQPIIPIVMERDYTPGAKWGWLGLIIAGELVHELFPHSSTLFCV